MRLILAALMAMTMIGCAFDREDSPGTDPGIVRQNNEVDRVYGPIVGTYNGTIVSGSVTQTVRLFITITNQTISNPDGTPAVRKVPTGTLTRIDPIGNDFNFNIAYVQQNGSFNMSNTVSSGLRDDDIYSVEGSLTGQRITGVVKSFTSANLGVIDLSLSSRETDLPDNDERNERRRRLYESVAGQYCGTIADPYDKKYTQKISVTLDLGSEDDPSSPTRTRPILVGRYERLDKVPRLLDLVLAVNFDTPPNITMQGRGNGRYSISFNGELKNSKIAALITTGTDGPIGRIELKKNDPVCKTQRPRDPLNPN